MDIINMKNDDFVFAIAFLLNFAILLGVIPAGGIPCHLL